MAMALLSIRTLFLLLTTAQRITAAAISRRDVVPAHSIGDASWPYQRYRTEAFTPPVLQISQQHPNASAGYFFLAPDGATEFEMAPLIMDARGELVWNGPSEHGFNFGVQTYRGEAVLVGWNGTVFPDPHGRGNGLVRVWNRHYEEIATVTLAGDFRVQDPGRAFASNVDVHEIFLTPAGSMLVTANNVTQADLTSVGGPRAGWIVESQFYEIDVATNEVLFAWKSLDHLDALPLTDSVYPIGAEGFDGASQENAWGYFHINSIAPFDDGYLISSRFLCSAIAIARSGEVKWQLRGRGDGDFQLGGGAEFCYQHHIRPDREYPTENGTIVTLHMHDNANSLIERDVIPSTAKTLEVDLHRKTATLSKQYINETNPIFSTAQGSFQPLPNGNVFVGHGLIPISEEYSAAGEILSTVQFGAAQVRAEGGFASPEMPTLNYRSFKQPWVGCPKTMPKIVVESAQNSSTSSTLYISWNGATEVEAWAIFNGAEMVSYAQTVPKLGFETAVNVTGMDKVQVRPVFKTGALPDCGQNATSVVLDLKTS